MPFQRLGLTDELVRGILATGFLAPTEIQSRAIPIALEGKDIIATAKTGTGKTAAFVLPILQRLASAPHRHSRRALIITPTRELAQQIEDAIHSYGRYLNIRTLAVYGGTNMQNQVKRLARGIDVLIATPGRLLDHLHRASIKLSNVEVLVLDEADRMLDMGFINDVKEIVRHLPRQRQTMMFSATISKPVRELMSTLQRHPILIEVGEQRSPVESVRQTFYALPREKKLPFLLHLLNHKELDSVLVFSRTKHGADKISHRLERSGITSVAIHSNRTQAQRQRALGGFRKGEYRVLVATDVAARGIDVEGISHVINYDMPNHPEDYIHRIGRTGRAQATGDAITFVAPDEIEHLRKLERFTSKHYELKKPPAFDEERHAQPAHAHHPWHTPVVHKAARKPKHARRNHRTPKHAQRARFDRQTPAAQAQPPEQAEKKDWRSIVTQIAHALVSKKKHGGGRK
jgi:ATP-dependent RNA helicase RhlE